MSNHVANTGFPNLFNPLPQGSGLVESPRRAYLFARNIALLRAETGKQWAKSPRLKAVGCLRAPVLLPQIGSKAIREQGDNVPLLADHSQLAVLNLPARKGWLPPVSTEAQASS
jgi:hypothetical protein